MSATDTVVVGKCLWFGLGYGFIVPQGADPKNKEMRVFVHHTQINKSGYKDLQPGDRVSYTLVNTPKGPAAYNVTVIKGVEDE